MWELNWGFNEWCTIATIGLSVVSIIIAICSSRSTSKDAHKQIREIKNLSALQIDTSIKQLEVEIHKTMAKIKISAKESKEIDDINKFGAQLGAEYRNMAMRKLHSSILNLYFSSNLLVL